MSEPPAQLVLDLPHRQAYDAEDFLVSPANLAAVELIDAWPEWPHWAAIVLGPTGCGKSHLANVWRARSGAEVVQADNVDDGTVACLKSTGALVVEDIDLGVANQAILFHLLNVARQDKSTLLLTSAKAPGTLAIELPDLRSRLRALPVVQIDPPDEPLLRAVLVKLFADRQLTVDPAVISYIALRMERSMKAAGEIVDKLDKLALSMRRKISRQLAQSALESVTTRNDFS